MDLSASKSVSDLVLAVVTARGVSVGPASPSLDAALSAATEAAAQDPVDAKGEATKAAVRELLRQGGYKPSGRNKPASEYLAQAAREGRFPRINNLVDVNNLVSLASGLPISLLDLSRFEGGLVARLGRAGERYVFNSAGQEIDLQGLILVASKTTDEPLGNPVKDSMRGKISPSTDAVVGVIYAPASYGVDQLARHLRTFADLLRDEGGARDVETDIFA